MKRKADRHNLESRRRGKKKKRERRRSDRASGKTRNGIEALLGRTWGGDRQV